jgi:hypothetical protein
MNQNQAQIPPQKKPQSKYIGNNCVKTEMSYKITKHGFVLCVMLSNERWNDLENKGMYNNIYPTAPCVSRAPQFLIPFRAAMQLFDLFPPLSARFPLSPLLPASRYAHPLVLTQPAVSALITSLAKLCSGLYFKISCMGRRNCRRVLAPGVTFWFPRVCN